MPHMKEADRKYLIQDAQGRELGESQGPTRELALVHLYRMDPKGPRISESLAREMIAERQVRFQLLA